MIFSCTRAQQVFRDRVLLRRVFSSGQDAGRVHLPVYNFCHAAPTAANGRGKRGRLRPPVAEVRAVLAAAFQQFPRLGASDDETRNEYTLKSWSDSNRGHVLYHYELMRCCLLSLSEVSAKRASFVDQRPAKRSRRVAESESPHVAPSPPLAHAAARLNLTDPSHSAAVQPSVPVRPLVPYPLTPGTPPEGHA